MSRYRRVETRVWADSAFKGFSGPQPNAQTLWLYLLCGPRTTIFPGLVVGREEVMASDLGWDIESFRKAFKEASAKDRAKVDWRAGLVVLQRALFDSHGDPRESSKPGNPNILKSWAKEWDQIPECDLKDKYLKDLKSFSEALGEAFTKAFNQALGKAYLKALAKPSPNQDQYQEQEQKQDLDPCDADASPSWRLNELVGKTTRAAKQLAREQRRKNKGHPDHADARSYWLAFWERRWPGQAATWNGKHGALLNGILTTHGLAEVKRRIDLLEASTEQWHRTWDFPAFAAQSDRLLAKADAKTTGRVEPKAPEEYPEGDIPL
jgi:hypothetical protein